METKAYKNVLRWLRLIPIGMMAVVLYAALFPVSDSTMTRMSIEAGSSTATLLVFIAFYFYPYFKFCNLTKLSVVGLCLNHLLYEIGACISYAKYDKWYTISAFGVSALIWLMLLFKDKKI